MMFFGFKIDFKIARQTSFESQRKLSLEITFGPADGQVVCDLITRLKFAAMISLELCENFHMKSTT